MARASGSGIGSWLSGPGGGGGYAGERLGLPATGSGSIARLGRRTGALCIDWLISYGIAALAMALGWVSLGALSTAVLVVWFAIGVISVRLFGFTPGQLALGLQVKAADGRAVVGVGRAVVRGLLITLVLPALFTDSDLRGLHDLASRTMVVRR